MERIQIITITLNFLFLFYVSRLIIRGRLREEYAIVWTLTTILLLIFSFWKNGLTVLSDLFGVFVPANLVFMGFIFIILVYLLHLSVVNSKLQKNITKLTQEVALLKETFERSEEVKTSNENIKN
ncbi:DUF2304 domain-containing protein [Pseudopedobacter beijingensis]|uniref:DUF2304 domain-containing protein n=1 Tax=Pseudopedobacter beijingensis TaxID=1207056 RepID=A0ABW4IBZ9_9SPHI